MPFIPSIIISPFSFYLICISPPASCEPHKQLLQNFDFATGIKAMIFWDKLQDVTKKNDKVAEVSLGQMCYSRYLGATLNEPRAVIIRKYSLTDLS